MAPTDHLLSSLERGSSLPGRTQCSLVPSKHSVLFNSGDTAKPTVDVDVDMVWSVTRVGPPQSALRYVTVDASGWRVSFPSERI